MMYRVLSILVLLTIAGCQGSSLGRDQLSATGPRPVSTEEFKDLARQYAFREKPGLNPQTEFDVREYEIPNLWKQLRAQVFLVRYLGNDGKEWASADLLCRDGKIMPITNTFGGWGLMSAVVDDNALFYTYSWGSGVHGSHIARLCVDGSRISIVESQPYWNRDVFVRLCENGVVAESGEFHSFNRWRCDSELGTLCVRGGTVTTISVKE